MPPSTTCNEHGQPVGAPVPGWTPRPLPGGATLRGRFVDVEPLTEAHVQGLFEALCGAGDDALWTYMSAGPFRLVTELREYLSRLWAAPDVVPFALVVDGRPVGIATYLRIQPAAGSVEVGSITYGRGLQRTAAATEAMYLMAAHVFDLGYRRYEWKCDHLNEPSRRAATRLGFTYEGRFRNATVYKSRTRDTDWFAMTDEDWAVLAPAYEAWLAAVAPDGRQGDSLGVRTAAALGGRGGGPADRVS